MKLSLALLLNEAQTPTVFWQTLFIHVDTLLRAVSLCPHSFYLTFRKTDDKGNIYKADYCLFKIWGYLCFPAHDIEQLPGTKEFFASFKLLLPFSKKAGKGHAIYISLENLQNISFKIFIKRYRATVLAWWRSFPNWFEKISAFSLLFCIPLILWLLCYHFNCTVGHILYTTFSIVKRMPLIMRNKMISWFLLRWHISAVSAQLL